jgi:hydrogenase maturation protease
VLVIGLGNALRHDDAVGLEVVRELRRRTDERPADAQPADGPPTETRPTEIVLREHEGEAIALLDLWEDTETVVLIDAVRSGAQPGTVHRLEASSEPLPAWLRRPSSTHAIGIGEAIELARALGRLPRRVLLYGIEGQSFEAGTGLSPEVAAAVGEVVEAVFSEAALGEARAPAGAESSDAG